MGNKMRVKMFVVGERPEPAPEGWRVFNAPRPLRGDVTWEDDFRHGRFYAAVNPDGDRAAQMVKDNLSLDAWEVSYLGDDEMRELVMGYYHTIAAGRGMKPEQVEKIGYPRLVEGFVMVEDGTVEEFMELDGTARFFLPQHDR